MSVNSGRLVSTGVFRRQLLNDDESADLLRFYTHDASSTLTDAQAIQLVSSRDITSEQEKLAVATIKCHHRKNMNTMNNVQKRQHLKSLCEAYMNAKEQSWMRSVFVKVVEDWVDLNSPSLDNAISEVFNTSNNLAQVSSPAA